MKKIILRYNRELEKVTQEVNDSLRDCKYLRNRLLNKIEDSLYYGEANQHSELGNIILQPDDAKLICKLIAEHVAMNYYLGCGKLHDGIEKTGIEILEKA